MARAAIPRSPSRSCCAAAFYAHGGLAGFRCCCRSCSCLCSCPCSCLCSCSCSCSCRAPSASRARRARRARRGPRSWSSCVVLVVNVVPAPRIFSACVLVLLLEEQRRENPHATAGNVREQSYALTCSTCLFASAVFAEDPPPSSTEQQSAPSRWREFPAKIFSERRPLSKGGASAGRAGGRASGLLF